MSDAKKCDRCGQFYDNYGCRDIKIFKENSVMDLCPACYKDFKNWILFISDTRSEKDEKDEQNDKND